MQHYSSYWEKITQDVSSSLIWEWTIALVFSCTIAFSRLFSLSMSLAISASPGFGWLDCSSLFDGFCPFLFPWFFHCLLRGSFRLLSSLLRCFGCLLYSLLVRPVRRLRSCFPFSAVFSTTILSLPPEALSAIGLSSTVALSTATPSSTTG